MENHRNMQQRIPGYHSSPSDVRPRYQERPTGDAGSTQRNGSQQPTGPREPGKIHDWTTYTQVKNSALTLGPASLALKYYPGLSRDIFPRLLVFLSLVSNTFFFLRNRSKDLMVDPSVFIKGLKMYTTVSQNHFGSGDFRID